ncbi:MAG: histidine--tRNA ligase [Bacteroidetes bacterium]|nr:histidine--tRNA ligase [Bacteroidota bacterium]
MKPALSKGTRDFLPGEVAKRNYIFDTIKGVFRKYGFEQIETPAIERLETLTGKYGEEGDKLLFKILNSGDYLKDVPAEELNKENASAITKHIAEKGLRYDLTVPLARYVVQHQDNLAFPFKRFHIGPVWRADRPQKGRYQEFYQCDADVIGSNSLLNEVELTKIYAEAFKALRLPVVIKVNNRKLIDEIFSKVGITDKKSEVITLIDKEDKIGWDGVKEQLLKLELSEDLVNELHGYLFNTPYSDFKDSAAAQEVKEVMKHFTDDTSVVFSASLMRGLDYYTGTIWEIKCPSSSIGSLGGGGRYDNLTEMFGGQNMSGVGISFGIERIYDVMEELNLFPDTISQGVKVLFVPRDSACELFAFEQVQQLRSQNLPAEIFLGNVKKQKHFGYVEQKNIPFMVEVGANELQSGLFILRNTKTRTTTPDLDLSGIAAILTAQ